MTKKTLTEIAINNSNWVKQAESKYSNIGFIKNECFRYLIKHTKEMIENQKQAEVLIFTCISKLELKGKCIAK